VSNAIGGLSSALLMLLWQIFYGGAAATPPRLRSA
jgi:hypothetical protein